MSDITWNPVIGCTPVSPGCLNCYAATTARRLEAMGKPDYAPRDEVTPERQTMPDAFGVRTIPATTKTVRIAEVKNGRAVFTGDVRCLPDRLAEPLGWKKPRMVFVNSMSDLFHEAVPFEFIDRVFAVMALCPQHTFQVLTKRPERMAEYLTRREISKAWSPSPRGGDGSDESAKWKTPCDRVYSIARSMKGREAAPELIWPLPNVWLGASVENQQTADERILRLLKCPAAVRFLSVEPLLGAVDFWPEMFGLTGDSWRGPRIDWVIVGGESGPHARPCDVAWIRSVVRQCKDAGVPCFVKQLGSWPMTIGRMPDGRHRLKDRKGVDPSEWPEDLRVREMPTTIAAASEGASK